MIRLLLSLTRILVLLFGFLSVAEATTYYVRTDAGTNTGHSGLSNDSTNAFLTITYASSHTSAGDIIRVQPGTYDEQGAISASGSAGNYKTFIADGAVICRGFQIAASYVNVIGFEVTHNSQTAFNDGIALSGTNSHIGVYDNYLHNIHAGHGGIVTLGTPTLTDITIRGNTITDTGYINGVQFELSSVAIACYRLTSERWLIEYNTAQRCGDFIYAASQHHVVRNNSLGDYEDRSLPTVLHVDGFQSGSDQIVQGTHDQVYEANWISNMRNNDSHVGLWQDTTLAGDTNIIFRGNLGYHVAAGGIGIISTKYFKSYNNTFDDLSYPAASAGNFNYIGFRVIASHPTDYPDRCSIVNSILSSDKNFQALNYSDATNFRAANNIGYRVSTDASYISTADPLYVNSGLLNFRLQSGSAGVNAGTYQTTVTSANGSGTSFNVADAINFYDGYGFTDGDTITVSGNTTTITGISGNTLTVSPSVSWTMGAGVYWGSSATPTVGAFPYGSTELTSATISNVGTTYTVTPTGDARGVWFYVNGIPTTWDATSPYSAVIASGTVTAKAYARYASPTPVVLAIPPPTLPTLPGHPRRRASGFIGF